MTPHPSSRLTAPQRLTIGSLFSGIGGLELGLERAGLGPVKWQVEINPYCRAVLAKHWPEAVRYEDVRSVCGSAVAPVDVICGGFPCQDISSAGAKAGITGPRSGLWSEFARIVGEARPRYVVVENVGALAARGLDVVLGDLADLGMDAIWFPLAAADVGAPHLRQRLFVVGYTDKHGEPDVPVDAEVAVVPTMADAERGRLQGWHVERPESGAIVATEDRWDARGQVLGAPWWHEPNVGRVAYGVPDQMERIQAIGNAVVPQVAEVVGHVVLGIDARLRGVMT